MVAVDASTALVRPWAQRHPIGLVMGALLVGGALAWSRPWRWLLTPALLAGLVPQMFSRFMAAVPSQAWVSVLASLMQQRPPAQRPAAVPPEQRHTPEPPLQSEAGSKNE